MGLADQSKDRRLLVVGPLPPPIGGGSVSVQVLLEELSHRAVVPVVVNTSPRSYRKKTQLARLETLERGARILWKYLREIRRCDAVIVYATNTLLLTLGYLFVLAARAWGKPIYLKPLGADLGSFIEARRAPLRGHLITVLQAATGVLAQTHQLQDELRALSCTNIYYVPGYRPPLTDCLSKRDGAGLHLVFVSQIVREKGPFLLLDAMRRLAAEAETDVRCDFYGPVLAEDRTAFFERLAATPGVEYCGLVQAGGASLLMTAYDALAFPTSYGGEGHPGVIIEAMQAGLPIISTHHRAIAELVEDGENGLLVPRGDCDALTAAIRRLAFDRPLREHMGRASQHRAKAFSSDVVIPQLLAMIFRDGRRPAHDHLACGSEKVD